MNYVPSVAKVGSAKLARKDFFLKKIVFQDFWNLMKKGKKRKFENEGEMMKKKDRNKSNENSLSDEIW